MKELKTKISLLLLALILVLSSAALAGGEKCAREAAAHKEKAAKMAAHGWLGLKSDDEHRVTAVVPGSPAAQAGFRAGDVLVAYNGIALTDTNKEALMKAKGDCAVGKAVSYTIRRDGAERTLSATLAPVPKEVLAEWMKEEEKTAQMADKH
jgi:predicted metalloprotease with PDZ domain